MIVYLSDRLYKGKFVNAAWMTVAAKKLRERGFTVIDPRNTTFPDHFTPADRTLLLLENMLEADVVMYKLRHKAPAKGNRTFFKGINILKITARSLDMLTVNVDEASASMLYGERTLPNGDQIAPPPMHLTPRKSRHAAPLTGKSAALAWPFVTPSDKLVA